jgi:hypothetical protein
MSKKADKEPEILAEEPKNEVQEAEAEKISKPAKLKKFSKFGKEK